MHGKDLTCTNKLMTYGLIYPHMSIDILRVVEGIVIRATWQRYDNVLYFNLYIYNSKINMALKSIYLYV